MRVRSEASAIATVRRDPRLRGVRGIAAGKTTRLSGVLCLGALVWFGASAAAGAAAPVAAQAPGRVIFSVNGGVVSSNVDGGGAAAAVALPNGGAVLVGGGLAQQPTGFYAAQLKPNGSLDASFGDGGVAHVVASMAPSGVEQIVRQPDGKLVVVGDGVPVNKLQFPPLVLVRLNADGSMDQSFGSGGVALLPIQDSCAGCTALALLPSGEFIVTGNTGQQSPAQGHNPNAVPDTKWVLARLTATGILDPSFAQSGIATLPETGGVGYDAAVLANGNIVTLGAAAGSRYLTRLLPSGAPDPAFNAGTPALLPAGFGLGMVANPDGSVMVGLRGGVVRYTTAGIPDPSFGPGGVAQVASAGLYRLLPAPGDGVLVVLQSVTVPGQLQVQRITTNGTVDSTLGGPSGLHFEVPFGGGESSFLVSLRPRPLLPLAQNTFRIASVVQRSDGSYLIVGGVRVSQPTGEGAGRSIFDFAAAALTPSFAPDASFGGSATPVHATLRIATQNATTTRTQHGIRVQLNVSAPGLCRVIIKANGRVIAQSMLPVFAAGPATLPVELTSYGDQSLRRHHRVKLRATAEARDLLTNTATATASGALR